MDQNAKQQAIEQLKNAGTVLITTTNNPNTDQVAAVLGLSQMLKKLGKTVSTIVTSKTPSNLSFLHPEKQFEDNLDSLRDFIVSLDKNLADKLRYKVEGDEVRIFITPYHSKISKDDIRFSQGDFNVDAVVILGASDRTNIDSVVMKNSRVLADTPVISVSIGSNQSSVGTIQWHDPQASSLSEVMVNASEALQGNLLDEVISNTLLTGIIAATNHFTNQDTSPKVMTMAAQLMAAGADQQKIMQELKTDAGTGTFKAPLHNDNSAKDTDTEPTETNNEADNQQSSDGNDMKIDHSKPEDSLAEAAPTPMLATGDLHSKLETAAPTENSLIDSAPALVAEEKPEPVTTPAPIVTDSNSLAPTPITATSENVPTQPEPANPVPAPVVDNKLEDARAAVEAAMNNQPTGAFNPAADSGAQPLTSLTPPISPNPPSLAPQVPKFTPPQPTEAPHPNPINPTPGQANPSSLYPSPHVPDQYNPPAIQE